MKKPIKMIKDKKADLIAGVPVNYEIAGGDDYTLTPSYLEFNMVAAISREAKSSKDELIAALPKGYNDVEFNDNEIVQYYDTYEACLKAVQKGEATYTYGNVYTLSNYLATGYYPNVIIVPDAKNLEMAIGMPKSANKNLYSVLSKTIYSLTNEDFKSALYSNTINMKRPMTVKQFLFKNLEIFLGIITLVLGSISILIYSIVRMKFKVLTEAKMLLLEKSQKDPLTGLYNRETCEELITGYLDRKMWSLQGAFIIMDIDYFKEINDSFGHQMGDELLKEFSQLLKEVFDKQDIICRLGGDEFIVFIPDIEEDAFQTVNQKLQQLCQLMNKEITKNGCSQKISLSIGAIIIKQEVKFKELYHQADTVLYEVKLGGRNGFKIKDFLEIKDS